VTREGIRNRRYWTLPAREHTDDLPTTVATIRELLRDSVTSQLVSDVPLCTLLSGGLDSSAVTALAAGARRKQGAGLRTFALDFAGYVEHFRPEYMRDTPDTPYARRMADHVASEHTTVVLSTADLIAPEHRAAVLRAHDLPFGRGDRDTSLYLLCKAVRRECRVALSGESADEVFGGYSWFRQPAIVNASTFPWLAMFGHVTDDGPDSRSSLLDRDLLKALDLPGYRAAAYRAALAEVVHPDGVSQVDEVPPCGGAPAGERRMREICYLTLTRLLPLLLDRMDRMSMANALEVRVPFLDHRLVEYVFNTPWAMKTFDGREKSLLRAATRDLLPPEVADRRKAPFPATQDAGYERALHAELVALLARDDAPVLPLLDAERSRALLAAPVGATSSNEARSNIELVLRLNAWLERYDVHLNPCH
jgi:asparagine synthase (glutamine-hydrolysing)